MRTALTFSLLLITLPVLGQECPTTAECVERSDLKKIVKLLDERQCLDKTTPSLKLDPVTIVTDSKGRVYYSGSQPRPYTVEMKWCHYTIQAEGSLEVVVAQTEPPTWGFRFRPKAHLGYLPFRILREHEFSEVVDAGLAVDFLYWQWVNLNVFAGFRSVGSGIGVDVTDNFGVLVGYGLSYEPPYQSLYSGIYFAF